MKSDLAPAIAKRMMTVIGLLSGISAATAFGGVAEVQASSGVGSASCIRNFYVNGATGNDVITSGTQSYPWKTIVYANNSGGLKAGDCVNVAPGTYAQSPLYSTSPGGGVNLTSGYVTSVGLSAKTTVTLTVSPGTTAIERIRANYVILDGFQTDGGGVASYAAGIIGAAPNLMVLKGIPKSLLKQ